MSRLGKKPIEIPEGVKLEISKDGLISVRGPKGELKRKFDINIIDIKTKENKIILKLLRRGKNSSALWGTYASHIKNMINGVLNGFSKELIIEGVGYRASLEGNSILLNVGFSHPVKIDAPEGIIFRIEKNFIVVAGIDKEKVGDLAAKIRSIRKPEPYKGKGIRYKDEVVRRKAGKKAATTA